MSTAIMKHDPTLSNLSDVRAVAEMFALSNYFDAKGNNPQAIAQIVTKIMAGRELGYGPFASVNGIHVIQGRTALSANIMAAAVKASGRYDYRVRKMDDSGVEVEFFEHVGGKRESLGVSTFTREDANKAGTQNMQKFARNMMFARAMSNGVKWFCPDVFNGSAVYVPEELGADVDGDGNVIDVQPTAVTPPPAAQNGNSNGHKAPRWDSAAAAYTWAVESGACANEHEARGSLKKIVDAKFGGRLTGDNMAAAFDAFHARQMEKLHDKADAAAQDAPELEGGEAVPA